MTLEILNIEEGPKLATSLTMAVETKMSIKLFVDDGCNKDGFNIPLEEILSDPLVGSFEYLRHTALVALFRYSSPNGNIPQYAMKNFGAVFICKLNGEEFTASNRTDMDEMLEKASAEHLMDDNDDTILDIKCTFKNKYQNEKMKKFRTGASIAADNVMKTLKNWVEKATNRFQVKDADQYVIVDGDGKAENLQSRSPDNWADRFVSFLFMPEKMHEHHKANHQNPSKKAFDLKETIDAITLDAVEGFARVFDLIDEAVAHKEAAHMARAEEWKLNKGKPVSDLEQVENLDVGVEILLEDDAEKTPEEWKIYFSKNSDDESLSNDVVLLEIPVADDVISISSDDTLTTDNFMHVHGGDDDSWTLLDDE